MSVYVIAEAGVNHNGSLDLALKLADAAKAAGADAVKYQTFKAGALVTPDAGVARYQRENLGEQKSQYEMLKELELTKGEFTQLAMHCKAIGIDFCTTTFDRDSTAFALDRLDLPFMKIPSGEITNLPFLEVAAASGKPIILSTGMCTMEEVADAVSVLRKAGASDITVLHCTTQYPAPYKDINLRAMREMGDILDLPFGYSDHTLGTEVSVAAVALGATVIEKHFTLDRTLSGPDHKASIEPDELRELVSQIRHVELAMGVKDKMVSEAESGNRDIVRKSIVAKVSINAGEEFTEDNLDVKRPGTGISPMKWHEVIGSYAKRAFDQNEMIEL